MDEEDAVCAMKDVRFVGLVLVLETFPPFRGDKSDQVFQVHVTRRVRLTTSLQAFRHYVEKEGG
jgi:hypothetical protein